jgi:spore coat polysaccharide biosynthesis predicted glycosyltransferase SpsG
VFVPVSGKYGMGEYARCAAIALAVTRRWNDAAIHFMLSRQAPYAAAAPFPATLLESSPTFHSPAVIEALEKLRPDVVIFDNAGRTSQLRAAKRLGARIVYISSRRRQRRKAFRWRWMRMIDEHWIAYPEFIAGKLRWHEKFKLLCLGRPALRYLDVILPQPSLGEREALLGRLGYVAGSYVLVVPGGGTGHPRAADAVAHFLIAASELAAGGVPTVFVGPPGAEDAAADTLKNPCLHRLGPLPQRELAALMRSSRLILANGGSTLMQGIACANACVAVPIARDQIRRIRQCVQHLVAVAAALDSADMVRTVNALLNDEPARAALARRAADLNLSDGIDISLRALEQLIETKPR